MNRQRFNKSLIAGKEFVVLQLIEKREYAALGINGVGRNCDGSRHIATKALRDTKIVSQIFYRKATIQPQSDRQSEFSDNELVLIGDSFTHGFFKAQAVERFRFERKGLFLNVN